MRFIKCSNYFVFFKNKWLNSSFICSSLDEYWSSLADAVFTDYPIAVVLNGIDFYVWTDRVI